MTNNPITPPPELVERWKNEPEYSDGRRKITMVTLSRERLQEIADQAARWGSDQELEACRLWVSEVHSIYDAAELLSQRRPKPPSLKEQALEALEREENLLPIKDSFRVKDFDTIRRALETLND